jgi:hypothetical protein
MPLAPIDDCQIWHDRTMSTSGVEGEGPTAQAAELDAQDKAAAKARDEADEDYKRLSCPKRCPHLDSTFYKLQVTTHIVPNRTKQTSNVHVHIHNHVHLKPSGNFPGFDYDFDQDIDYDWFKAMAIGTWLYKARCIGGKTVSSE